MRDIKRWTVNCLPDDDTTAILAAYADNPMFDDIIRGYRAGSGHGTKPFSYPHATSVHFECTEEDFMKVVHFVSDWLSKNPGVIESQLKEDSLEKPVLIPVPAGYTAYFTNPADSDKETCWVDFNLKKDPFIPLHTALVGFIKELSVSSGYEIKIINGITYGDIDKHRPHFTGMRADAEAAKIIDFPASGLAADHFIKFTVSAGTSPRSGEYPAPQFLFDENGICIPVAPTEKQAPITEAFKLHQASFGAAVVETISLEKMATKAFNPNHLI